VITTVLDDLKKCATFKFFDGRCEIRCKRDLWCVDGYWGVGLVHEANYYFQQYKEDGEYDDLLAGDEA